MKEYKTFNQQLTILRNRGLIVPTDGKPKRFLEQENYYNLLNEDAIQHQMELAKEYGIYGFCY